MGTAAPGERGPYTSRLQRGQTPPPPDHRPHRTQGRAPAWGGGRSPRSASAGVGLFRSGWWWPWPLRLRLASTLGRPTEREARPGSLRILLNPCAGNHPVIARDLSCKRRRKSGKRRRKSGKRRRKSEPLGTTGETRQDTGSEVLFWAFSGSQRSGNQATRGKEPGQ